MIGRPAVGLIALTVTFLGQPLARAVNRVLLAWLDDWAIVGFAGLGVVGVFVVATHLTAQENRASVAGFIGGLLIWRGFFSTDRYGFSPIGSAFNRSTSVVSRWVADMRS